MTVGARVGVGLQDELRQLGRNRAVILSEPTPSPPDRHAVSTRASLLSPTSYNGEERNWGLLTGSTIACIMRVLTSKLVVVAIAIFGVALLTNHSVHASNSITKPAYCNPPAAGVVCEPTIDVTETYTTLIIHAYCGTEESPRKPSKLTCSSPSTIIDCGEPQETSTYRQCTCNSPPPNGHKYKAKPHIHCD